MWKLCRSRKSRGKSRTFLLFLPLNTIRALIFCLKAYGAPPSEAHLAGGCYGCTEAVFQNTVGVPLRLHSKGGRPCKSRLILPEPAMRNVLGLFWRAHDPTEVEEPGTGHWQTISLRDLLRPRAATHNGREIEKKGAKICTQNRSQLKFLQPVRFRPAPGNQQNFCRMNPNHPVTFVYIIIPELQPRA